MPNWYNPEQIKVNFTNQSKPEPPLRQQVKPEEISLDLRSNHSADSLTEWGTRPDTVKPASPRI